MDERVMQFRVGVVVFATLILAMTLILMFSDTEFWRPPGRRVRDPHALSPGPPVWPSGRPCG